ncbi:hypothetical protein [Bacillus inaquosorum]|uniref:hypothetical protein n=1 Tax=Bacillus inaquosorum TaxID=483913 RepID=UPI00227F3DB6|nr:hypothetical protein [Bacillus inaquosorum]MCY9034709.1 hypothetical protein [Bacillus inaquosorum]
MAVLRIGFIVISIIMISNIPSINTDTIFTSRFVFHGMLLLDYINLHKYNKGSFGQIVAVAGIVGTGIFIFLDLSGLFKFLMLKNSNGHYFIVGNHDYTFLRWIPSFSLENYIVITGLLIIFIAIAELFHSFTRTKPKTEANPLDAVSNL